VKSISYSKFADRFHLNYNLYIGVACWYFIKEVPVFFNKLSMLNASEATVRLIFSKVFLLL